MLVGRSFYDAALLGVEQLETDATSNSHLQEWPMAAAVTVLWMSSACHASDVCLKHCCPVLSDMAGSLAFLVCLSHLLYLLA